LMLLAGAILSLAATMFTRYKQTFAEAL